MTTRKQVLALIGAMATMAAVAAPSVEITAVQQQYPWTNTVDITYEVRGVTNMEYFVRFTPTTSDDDPILNVEGEASIQVALESNGVFTAQWYPQTNLQYTACKMTPAIFRGGSGGGNDYLVIDLDTWTYAYEPMATQEASNQRYQATDYKTRYLVLRRIEGGRKYWIGNASNSKPTDGYDSYHEVNVAKDYYIGIYELTQGQWARIVGDGYSKTATEPMGRNISWNTIRGSALAGAIPTKGIFAVLNQKANLGAGFDLPTESMWEIAARGDWTTTYIGSNTSTDLNYAWCSDNIGGVVKPVGTKLPNSLGIYDVVGNVWEQVRDVWNSGDLATLQPEALTPITSGDVNRSALRGGGRNTAANQAWGSLSSRSCAGWTHGSTDASNHHVGFRVAYIPQ